MGIDSRKNILSPKNLPLPGARFLCSSNPAEVHDQKQKLPSNVAGKALGSHHGRSIEGTNEGVPLRSCKKSSEAKESRSLPCKHHNKSFKSSNSLDKSGMGSKSRRSPNVSTSADSKVGSGCTKVEKSGSKGSSVCRRALSSPSLSGSESPNSVLLKHEEDSKSKAFSKKSRSHGEPTLSFGNIYKGPIMRKDSPGHTSFTVNSTDCNECRDKPKPPVLGLGGGNYGHGSVIKSVIAPGTCPSHKINRNCRNAGEFKNAGNEEYRRGNFSEAITLYEQGISLSPRNALCHSNKAAALVALGRYAEAVEECLEAIKCDPSYWRAHHRIGSLYMRLGWLEDAKRHFLLCGQQPDSESMQKLLHIKSLLSNMENAKKLEDWTGVLTASNLAMCAGADGSCQVLAYKAEALLKLHKADDALEVLAVAAKKLRNSKTKRFDAGVKAAEHAVSLDSGPESLLWLRKAQSVATARKTGNELYNDGKYLEACRTYGRGLQYAPSNSVLLSNRAACLSKLGQWEKAIDDCTSALANRPDYVKARLRRAYLYTRLKQWEESVTDYKLLSQERPADCSIALSLHQVEQELKKIQQAACKSHIGSQMASVFGY